MSQVIENTITPELQISNLASGYAGATVIRNVSLKVKHGEIFALLGKNGMGKSTLLKTIFGFLPLMQGKIEIRGVDVSGQPPHKIAKRSIAYCPQEQAIFQDLTVRENLRLGVADESGLDDSIDFAASYFPIIKSRLNQKAGTLSGGEQKMLILSRAFLSKPRLILIDEISEGLQPLMIEKVSKMLISAQETTGATIFLVEQNVGFALGLADRYAILKVGEIAETGEAKNAGTLEAVRAHLSV